MPGISGEFMKRIAENKRAVLAIMVAMLLLAVVVPTCRMIGCIIDMGSAGMSGMMHEPLATFSADCQGEWLLTDTMLAVVGEPMALVALVAVAFMAAYTVMAPQAVTRLVRIEDRAPPPSPYDPWGERFRL